MTGKDHFEYEREKIRRIDDQIFQLISERLTIAQRIGEFKRKENLPIRDYQVEQDVLKRNLENAKNLEVSTDMAKNLVDLLINEAVRVQEQYNNNISEIQNSKKVLLIGGLGKMGAWLGDFFRSCGYTIEIIDKSEDNYKSKFHELPKIINDYEFVGICSPLCSLQSVMKELIKLRPRGIVFDIGSLKSHILDEIKIGINQKLKITSLHPLFGPDIRTLNGRNVILATCGSEEADRKVKELFNLTACNLVEIPVHEHDKYMSISLGLSHAINLLFGIVITKSNFVQNIDNFASTTFLKQLRTANEVFSENPELYYSIQKLNENKDNLYENLFSGLKELKQMVDKSTPNAFTEFMIKTKGFFETH